MANVSEKRTYEKPMLEACGSMVEQTLCDGSYNDFSGSHIGTTGFGNPHTPSNPTGNPHTPGNPHGNPHGRR